MLLWYAEYGQGYVLIFNLLSVHKIEATLFLDLMWFEPMASAIIFFWYSYRYLYSHDIAGLFGVTYSQDYKRFFEKKLSCSIVFQNWPTYSPILYIGIYKTFTLSKITEAWQYSNIMCICARYICILNFNLLLCSVPEIYIHLPSKYKDLQYTSQNHSSVKIF